MYSVEIDIRQDDLLADIANRLKLAADSAGGNADLHNATDVLDDGNREIVTGLIARYMYETMNILHPFAKTPVRRFRKEGGDDDAEMYGICLVFEKARSETQVQQLERLIRDYVVYRCFAEWLEMTMPGANTYTMWEQKAEDVKEQIGNCLVLPYSPKQLRVRPHWYCSD